MRRWFILVLANVITTIVLMISFSACRKSEEPTTPTTRNSFKITSIRELMGDDLGGQYYKLYLFTNATKDVGYASGTISYGDGASEDIPDFQLVPSAFNREIDARPPSCVHYYVSAGTYHVDVKLVARFSNSDITAILDGDFAIVK